MIELVEGNVEAQEYNHCKDCAKVDSCECILQMKDTISWFNITWEMFIGLNRACEQFEANEKVPILEKS